MDNLKGLGLGCCAARTVVVVVASAVLVLKARGGGAEGTWQVGQSYSHWHTNEYICVCVYVDVCVHVCVCVFVVPSTQAPPGWLALG